MRLNVSQSKCAIFSFFFLLFLPTKNSQVPISDRHRVSLLGCETEQVKETADGADSPFTGRWGSRW